MQTNRWLLSAALLLGPLAFEGLGQSQSFRQQIEADWLRQERVRGCDAAAAKRPTDSRVTPEQDAAMQEFADNWMPLGVWVLAAG